MIFLSTNSVGKAVNNNKEVAMCGGRNDNVHGDEPEIEAIARQVAEEYEAEHADDWKYKDLECYEHE